MMYLGKMDKSEVFKKKSLVPFSYIHVFRDEDYTTYTQLEIILICKRGFCSEFTFFFIWQYHLSIRNNVTLPVTKNRSNPYVFLKYSY